MHIEGLEELDNRIVEIIKDNARLTYSEIGAKAGVSRISVKKRMEDGHGLRKIRNLGTRSENEIIEKIKEMEEIYAKTHAAGSESEKRTIIKPAKKIWDMGIDQFHLSNYSLQRLSACGIKQIRDLYATNPKKEPGWYAVRELFEKIPSAR